MLTLHRRTWPQLYAAAIKQALREGYERPSREGTTIEVGPAMLGCPAPTFCRLVGRGGSDEFARIEQLCYLARVNPDPLVAVAPRYIRFMEADGTWFGAYGPRLDLHHVVRELSRQPDSRRGVTLIWRPDDLQQIHERAPKDIPCTISLTYWVGPAGEIRSIAHMRSSDLWFGLYYDLPAFAFLQRVVAKTLRRPAGYTFLTATSFHLYAKDFDRAQKVRPRLVRDAKLIHPVIPDPTSDFPTDRLTWLQEWAQGELNV